MSSLSVVGAATNPSAGGAVATTGNLSAGKYTVVAVTQPTGTIAAGDLNNMQLQVGATVIGKLLVSTTAGTATASPPFTVDVPAATAITVNAVGNASGASAVYNAQIVYSIA